MSGRTGRRGLLRLLPRLAAELVIIVLGVFIALWADSLAFMPEWVLERRGIAYRDRDGDPSALLRDPELADALFVRTIYESNIVTFYRRQGEELDSTLALVRRELPNERDGTGR